MNEGTPYGAGALQKNILALIPASKATISRALEAERNAGMSGISVIRNNAAPFLFRTIPIPSVHDAGWHVRVYEASRTVKKRCPVVSEKAPMSSGALPSADTSNGNSLITLIFIIPQRPSGRFSGIWSSPHPQGKETCWKWEKTGIIKKRFRHARRNYTLPFLPIPEKHGLTRACRLRNAWTICMIDHPLRIYPLLYKLQCRH